MIDVSKSKFARNLERGTLYYVKSYAQNILGYSYGQELSFETLSELASVLTFNPTSSSGWIQAGGLISDSPRVDEVAADPPARLRYCAETRGGAARELAEPWRD